MKIPSTKVIMMITLMLLSIGLSFMLGIQEGYHRGITLQQDRYEKYMDQHCPNHGQLIIKPLNTTGGMILWE